MEAIFIIIGTILFCGFYLPKFGDRFKERTGEEPLIPSLFLELAYLYFYILILSTVAPSEILEFILLTDVILIIVSFFKICRKYGLFNAINLMLYNSVVTVLLIFTLIGLILTLGGLEKGSKK